LHFYPKVIRVRLTPDIQVGTGRALTEVAGNDRQLFQVGGTDARLVAHHVVGIFARFSVVVIHVRAETISIQVDILHVLRSESVLYIHTIQGSVTTLALGVERVNTDGTTGEITPGPDRAYHEIGVLEAVGLDLIRPARIYLTCF
jgi:hypothetical protein